MSWIPASIAIRRGSPLILFSELTFFPGILGALSRWPCTEASTPPGSFGIGLFIAHEVASAHGGSVAVVSAPDETVFTIQLPRSFAVTA